MINEKLKVYVKCSFQSTYILSFKNFYRPFLFLHNLVPGNMRNNVGTEQ